MQATSLRRGLKFPFLGLSQHSVSLDGSCQVSGLGVGGLEWGGLFLKHRLLTGFMRNENCSWNLKIKCIFYGGS